MEVRTTKEEGIEEKKEVWNTKKKLALKRNQEKREVI